MVSKKHAEGNSFFMPHENFVIILLEEKGKILAFIITVLAAESLKMGHKQAV